MKQIHPRFRYPLAALMVSLLTVIALAVLPAPRAWLAQLFVESREFSRPFAQSSVTFAPVPDGVTGIIRYHNGMPLANADIRLHIPGAGTFPATTDAAGRYAVKGVPDGTYEIQAEYVPQDALTPVVNGVTVVAGGAAVPDLTIPDFLACDVVIVTDCVVSLAHVGGTAPVDAPELSAVLDADELNLAITGGDGDGLDSIGADESTTFEAILRLRSLRPDLATGRGRGVRWSASNDGADLLITFTGRPVMVELLEPAPSPDDWPTGDQDRANMPPVLMLSLAFHQLDGLQQADRDALAGTVILTDAMVMTVPTYTAPGDGVPGRLALTIGGPHLTADGQENTGFAEAFLPQALMRAWRTVPPGLTATFDGEGEPVVTPERGGVRLDLPVHYSAGELVISHEERPGRRPDPKPGPGPGKGRKPGDG